MSGFNNLDKLIHVLIQYKYLEIILTIIVYEIEMMGFMHKLLLFWILTILGELIDLMIHNIYQSQGLALHFIVTFKTLFPVMNIFPLCLMLYYVCRRHAGIYKQILIKTWTYIGLVAFILISMTYFTKKRTSIPMQILAWIMVHLINVISYIYLYIKQQINKRIVLVFGVLCIIIHGFILPFKPQNKSKSKSMSYLSSTFILILYLYYLWFVIMFQFFSKLHKVNVLPKKFTNSIIIIQDKDSGLLTEV